MTLAEKIASALVVDLAIGGKRTVGEMERDWAAIVERKIREATGVR